MDIHGPWSDISQKEPTNAAIFERRRPLRLIITLANAMLDHLGRALGANDEKQAAAIERRRKVEEERKARIFHDKTRTKGVRMVWLLM